MAGQKGTDQARGPASTPGVDGNLKVKDMKYNIGLTKNYCIIISKQKISSNHELIFMIEQILGSHEVKGHN